jgi:hypothetical protein
MEETDIQPNLSKEDTLWPALAFDVLTKEELARRQADVEETVHLHGGVWWRQAGPFFCLPCDPYAKIDARQSRPSSIRSLCGYMHLASEGSPSNAEFPAILRDNVFNYHLRSLGMSRRYKIRKALRVGMVRPIEKLDDMLRDGYEVYASWHSRVQWGRNRCNRKKYEAWIMRELQQPKGLPLGAYFGSKLVAFILPSACGDTATLNFAASHSDYLDSYANDLLYHALLTVARQTPGIERVYFGPSSSKASLDHFKLHYATLRYLPAYVWINPLANAVAGKQLLRRHPWLATIPMAQPALA